MAILASIATGNFTTNTTWGVVDATSYNGAQTTGNAFTTAYSATNRTTAFTPGAITVSHIGFKLANRTGTTGTLKLHIALSATHVEVAGTEVTINTADLPVAATADINGGWHFLKLATPVTLLAATSYEVEGKTSSATQITPFSSATASNFSIALITTTNQAPAAGDDLIIGGEYTGAGTSNSFTVTMNQTATTDYGSTPTAANSLITPGLAICNKGTLTWETTAATNYNLKISNSIIIYSGGTMNMGTSGTPCPRDSTMTLTFDCGTNVDYGLVARNLGTLNVYGQSRTSGKNIYYCKLNTDEAIASTSLGVDTDTGWLDNDEIAISSTTRTIGQCEAGALNGAAGASTLTVDGFAGAGGGLAYAHSGTSPTQAEVILLTRNVKIIGASATLQAYISTAATSTVTFSWAEFKWMGSGTAGKRGINITTTTGTFSAQYCSFRNFEVASSTGLFITSNTTTITISYNVFYSIYSEPIYISSGNSTVTFNITRCVIIKTTGANGIYYSTGANMIVTDCYIAGCGAYGISIPTSYIPFTVTGCVIHSNGSMGINHSNVAGPCSIINTSIWRNSSYGIGTTYVHGWTLTNVLIFGNATTNLNAAYTFLGVIMTDCTLAGDTSFATTNGYSSQTGATSVQMTNCTFGVTSGIYVAHTTDLSLVTYGFYQFYLNNCKLASATEFSSISTMAQKSIVSSQKHDQTAGLHKTWLPYGILTIETTTVQGGGTSLKMTPSSSTYKLESYGAQGGFKVIVGNGQTCTPTVYVYEDASYNGARARLIVKRNDAMGISADTVLDTATAASDAAWEALTGTTAAVTADGVLEFIVDCDGTAGNLFVDTFSATVA